MGHALTFVLVPRTARNPTRAAERLLAPYDLNLDAPRRWRWYPEEGDRKRPPTRAELRKLQAEAQRENEQFIALGSERRAGVDPTKGFYYLLDYNRQGMWDECQLGGDWNGIVPGNVCRVSELPKDFFPFHLITPNGKWHQKADITKKADREWRPHVKRLLARYRDCTVVVVDIHE